LSFGLNSGLLDLPVLTGEDGGVLEGDVLGELSGDDRGEDLIVWNKAPLGGRVPACSISLSCIFSFLAACCADSNLV